MFNQVLRGAGESGFLWRDQSIMEKIDREGASKYKVFQISVYALVALTIIGAGVSTGGLAVMLYALFVLGLRPLITWWEDNGELLSVPHYVPFVVEAISATFLPAMIFGVVSLGSHIGLTWLALSVVPFAVLNGEMRTLTSALMVSALSLPSWWAIGISIIVLCLGCYFSSFTHEHIFANIKRATPWPKVPLGFHKAADNILAKSLKRKNDEISRRDIGAATEVETARIIAQLPRAYVFHDVILPGADDANIDHLIVCSRGVFIIDSKRYRGTVTKDGEGVSLQRRSRTGHIESKDLNPVISQMDWAGSAISSILKREVYTLVAVHGGKLFNDEEILLKSPQTEQKIAFLQVTDLVPFIEIMDVVLSTGEVRQIADEIRPHIGRAPAYTGARGKILRRNNA